MLSPTCLRGDQNSRWQKDAPNVVELLDLLTPCLQRTAVGQWPNKIQGVEIGPLIRDSLKLIASARKREGLVGPITQGALLIQRRTELDRVICRLETEEWFEGLPYLRLLRSMLSLIFHTYGDYGIDWSGSR